MRIIVGIAATAAWILYFGQLISVLDFRLAQRLGLQESPEATDALASHLELWTARWDLAWLWTLPAAGTLMLLDHPWWPYAALIGGAASIDTGGREAAKVRGLIRRGIRIGTDGQRRLIASVFIYLVAAGVLMTAASLQAIA